uniref:BZIP domain-containing protein n=1 Tax=Plectus sambesii TaxID=2011161 RepID=A0A914VKQ8_9BILA
MAPGRSRRLCALTYCLKGDGVSSQPTGGAQSYLGRSVVVWLRLSTSSVGISTIMTTVEGQHHHQQHHHAAAAAAAAANLYDPKAFKNYAAMSAMCWPGFDPASSYSTAAYTQTAAFAAAANSLTSSTGSGPKSEPSTPATLSSVLSSQSFSFPAHSTTPSTPPSKKKAQPVPVDQKDQAYWERRHRNNESARRSRESRRQKEEAVSFRVVYLENENMQLRTEVGMLRQEIEKLRSLMVYSTAHHAVHH